MPFTPQSPRPRKRARPLPTPVRTPPDARRVSTKNESLTTRVHQHTPIGPRFGKTTLALDPGGSTGVALRLPDGRVLTNTVQDPGDIWDFFIERPDYVVFEIFATGGRVDRFMIYTIELVGGIKAVCYALGIRSFAHPPQKRYPWLKEADSLLAGIAHTKHEVDALAHLLALEELHPELWP